MEKIQLQLSLEDERVRIRFKGLDPQQSRDDYVQYKLGEWGIQYELTGENDEFDIVIAKCKGIQKIQGEEGQGIAHIEVFRKSIGILFDHIPRCYPSPELTFEVSTEDRNPIITIPIPLTFTPDEYREALGLWCFTQRSDGKSIYYVQRHHEDTYPKITRAMREAWAKSRELVKNVVFMG